MSNKRYEWWKGTSEIIDNKTKKFITLDCPDLLNKQDQRIAELKAENERLKDENKVLKEIRGLKSKELKKRPHELTQKEAYQKGWENAISETIRTFEFNYGKDKVELVEERDKYFSDIYRIGGYKFTIEDLQQQLKQQLHDLPKKIVEDCKMALIKRINIISGYGRMTIDEQSFFLENEYGKDLDTILKKYGVENE